MPDQMFIFFLYQMLFCYVWMNSSLVATFFLVEHISQTSYFREYIIWKNISTYFFPYMPTTLGIIMWISNIAKINQTGCIRNPTERDYCYLVKKPRNLGIYFTANRAEGMDDENAARLCFAISSANCDSPLTHSNPMHRNIGLIMNCQHQRERISPRMYCFSLDRVRGIFARN